MKKMNKKGFTLVELLAVIAILAILILLVTPNILKMFNEGKESVFVQQAQRVMDASNTKFMSVSLKNPGAYVFSNVDGATDTTNLNLTNDSVTYCVKMDNEGNIRIRTLDRVDFTNITVKGDKVNAEITVRPEIDDISAEDRKEEFEKIKSEYLKFVQKRRDYKYIVSAANTAKPMPQVIFVT